MDGGQYYVYYFERLAIRKTKQQDNSLLFHFARTTNVASSHKRSLRGVESVFFHRPNATVVVRVKDDGETTALETDMTSKPFLPLTNAGYNITLQRFKIKAACGRRAFFATRRWRRQAPIRDEGKCRSLDGKAYYAEHDEMDLVCRDK